MGLFANEYFGIRDGNICLMFKVIMGNSGSLISPTPFHSALSSATTSITKWKHSLC